MFRRDAKLLLGVIHLDPLPGSPRFGGDLPAVIDGASRDAEALARAGFDAVIVENFGDAPFFRGRVGVETVASMAVICDAVRRASSLPLGVNVLRNDGESAFAIAAATGARFIRVNVLVGARVTDQGLVEGDAATLLRAWMRMGAAGVSIAADVDVKHGVPLGAQALSPEDEALEAVERALADAVIVTGSRTGAEADVAVIERVLKGRPAHARVARERRAPRDRRGVAPLRRRDHRRERASRRRSRGRTHRRRAREDLRRGLPLSACWTRRLKARDDRPDCDPPKEQLRAYRHVHRDAPCRSAA